MSRHYCHSCEEVSQEFELVPYGEFNPEARRTLDYLACPCGEREDVVEAYQCDGCEEYFPSERLEEGSDLCIECYQKENGLA